MPSRPDRHVKSQLNVRLPADVFRLIAALQNLHQRRFPGISQADIISMCVREEARRERLISESHRES